MTYTTAQAARAAGIQSNVTIRNYTRDARLTPYFSETAITTPRQLTSEDVRLLKFIADATRRGETIPAVVKRLENKELTTFDWSPPDPEDQQRPTQQRSNTALLDPNLTMLLQTLQAEFTAARAHSENLQHELIQSETQRLLAEQELARVQQELDQLKTSRRSLWQRLTGR